MKKYYYTFIIILVTDIYMLKVKFKTPNIKMNLNINTKAFFLIFIDIIPPAEFIGIVSA